MKRLCDWFNRYRDGELDRQEQERFQQHMRVCDECRTLSSLLDNVVRALKSRELAPPNQLPARTAARAFENSGSWDVLFLSWLKPVPAWSALTLLAILLSVLWVVPDIRQKNANGEYEALMMETDPSRLSGNAPQGETDDALVIWLEQGGDTR